MQIYRLRINQVICTGCNVCVVSCPINFNQLKEKGYLTEKNAVLLVRNGIARNVYEDDRDVNCDGCGVCIENCPQTAIKIEILNY